MAGNKFLRRHPDKCVFHYPVRDKLVGIVYAIHMGIYFYLCNICPFRRDQDYRIFNQKDCFEMM